MNLGFSAGLVVDILNTCDFKCNTLQLYLYLYVSYPKCVYIFGTLCIHLFLQYSL
jgi:hypothetical protein